MLVTPIKTRLVKPSSISLLDFLDESVKQLQENQILVITSKVVSLCQGRSVGKDKSTKEELIASEADLFMPNDKSRYGYHFSIIGNTLVAAAGIDESNSDGTYVLLPSDIQKTANQIRDFLSKKFKVKSLGIIIVDSTSRPLRRGASGVSLAHSGFLALNSYIGSKDLFGRKITHSTADVSGGLAASAVLAMGEGREQTPICIIKDVPFVQFQDRPPSLHELKTYYLSINEDIFEPLLKELPWQKGRKN